MLHIETHSVYAAYTNELGIEFRGALKAHDHTIGFAEVYSSVTGLQPYDLAVFGTEMTDTDMRTGEDWLVTEYQGGEATLVNSTTLLANPEWYITPHLEMLLRRVGPIEASELGIDALIASIYKKNSTVGA